MSVFGVSPSKSKTCPISQTKQWSFDVLWSSDMSGSREHCHAKCTHVRKQIWHVRFGTRRPRHVKTIDCQSINHFFFLTRNICWIQHYDLIPSHEGRRTFTWLEKLVPVVIAFSTYIHPNPSVANCSNWERLLELPLAFTCPELLRNKVGNIDKMQRVHTCSLWLLTHIMWNVGNQ